MLNIYDNDNITAILENTTKYAKDMCFTERLITQKKDNLSFTCFIYSQNELQKANNNSSEY